MCLAPSLPQELKEAIIGHIRERRTLALCSLVSSSFLHACRRNLFAKLCIDQDNVSTLPTILNSPLCTFPCHVYHLVLRDPAEVPDYGNRGDWVDELIPQLKHFPNISSLSITIGRETFFLETLLHIKEFFAELAKVTTLSLHNIYLYNGYQAYRFIFDFLPSLKRIDLYDVEIKHHYWVEDRPRFPQQLHTLMIHGSGLAMTGGAIVPHLHTLALINVSPESINTIGDLIYSTKETLEKLALGFREGCFYQVLQEEIVLRHNKKLRVFHVTSGGTLDEESGGQAPETPGGHIPILLSDINAKSLQELHLDLRPNSDSVLPKHGQTDSVWNDIMGIIPNNLTNLRKIVVTVPSSASQEIQLSDDLADLVSNGVLQIRGRDGSQDEISLEAERILTDD